MPPLGVHHVQCGVQKILLHAAQHLHDLGRCVAGQAGGRAVEGVGEQVVLHHHLARHAQGQQDECGGEARAVLACGAVEDQRVVALHQHPQQRGKARGVVVHEAAVGVLHQASGVLG